jgi:hypothetical protein
MRSLRGGLVCAAIVLSACHVGFRSSAGTAALPKAATEAGAQRGMSRSVSMGDEGGLLTMAVVKAGLVGAGALGAAGSVEVTEYKESATSIVYNSDGSKTYVKSSEATVKVDQGQAQRSADLMNTTPTPDGLRFGRGALATNLEIASTSLGGDTSGYQFQFGYAYRMMYRRSGLVMRARGFAGLGFGHWTIHGRETRMDRGPPTFEDYRYGFFGIPVRVAGMIGKPRRDGLELVPEFGLEPYVGTELNLNDPTPFRAGARLILSYVHIDVEWAKSSAGSSVSLEIGGGI